MAYNPNPGGIAPGTNINMNRYGTEKEALKAAMSYGYIFEDKTGFDGALLTKTLMAGWKLNPQRKQDAAAAEIFKKSKGLFAKGAMPRLRIRTPEEFRLSNGGLQDVRIPLTSTQQTAARVGAQVAMGGLNIPVG